MENKDVSISDDKAIEIISELINTHRNNAYRKVNEELISLYWEVGKYLSQKVTTAKKGAVTK